MSKLQSLITAAIRALTVGIIFLNLPQAIHTRSSLSFQPGLLNSGGAPSVISANENLLHDSVSQQEHLRARRDVIVASEHSNVTRSVTQLNDTHKSLVVHWAGGDVILCLAKDLYDANSSSTLYLSQDYGQSFKNVTNMLGHTMSAGELPSLDKFFGHPDNNGRLVFTDVKNNYIFTTTNYGKEFRETKVLFVPNEIIFHPHAPDTILAHEAKTEDKRLWLSKDFGGSWTMVEEFVESLSWDESVEPAELYILRKEPEEKGSIITSKSLFLEHTDTNVVLSEVDEFEIKDDYKFAVRSSVNSSKLFISYMGGKFFPAMFPTTRRTLYFHVADVAEGQVFICVTHENSMTDLYIGNAPPHKEEGIRFTMSLERIVFFKPNVTWTQSWLHDVSTEEFVDLHRVEGLRGVYIASAVSSDPSSSSPDNLRFDEVVSKVSYDSGGEWVSLKTPEFDDDGQPIYCSRVSQNCSLHISQRLSQLYPQARAVPVLSKKSAVGLVLATGTIGKSLKSGRLGVFMSNDGAFTWKQLLQGNYLFGFGDHGGIMVAVKLYKLGHATDSLLFSTDEGETWNKYKFYDEEIRVLELLTEPGENSTVFIIFGSTTKNSSHSWVLIKVDFSGAFDRNCTKEDYKLWSPWDSKPDRDCLLGKKDFYQRRIPSSRCYNGVPYEQKVKSSQCVCSRIDFECDFGYTDDPSEPGECVKDVSEFSPGVKAEWCKPGNKFYNRTKGYRKIPNDICVGGNVEKYTPDVRPCGVSEVPEFLLVAKRDAILRINLNDYTQIETLPVMQPRGVVAVDFDFEGNTLYWSDVSEDQVLRLRLDGNSTVETLVSSEVTSVEGIAFDWISRNLYFCDSNGAKIEVIRTDVHGMGRMRKKILSKPTLDKPRSIAVHPVKGFLFWTDWSGITPGIGRSSLDGSDAQKIVKNTIKDSPVITWPNGLTIDYVTDKLYWVDARLDHMASVNFDGSNVRILMKNDMRLHHPFAIAVFKDTIYWNDWQTHGIYGTSAKSGSPSSEAFLVSSNYTRLMDMRTVFSGKQLGTNLCKNSTCSFLCLALPASNSYSCDCPDGLKKNGSSCVCPDGEPVPSSGMCGNAMCGEPNVYKCKTADHCIPENWKCDGDDDCGDNSDEEPELCHLGGPCAAGQFQCPAEKTCIPDNWRCDYDSDCSDGADEKGCDDHFPKCDVDHFQCNNKKCILKKWVCDGDNDCYDNSDETNCTLHPGNCQPEEFKCLGSSKCISIQYKCDGEPDCPDHSDEVNCTAVACPSYKFQCHDSKECILTSWVCDGENDCIDGSDEKNCSNIPVTPPSHFDFHNCSANPGMFQCAVSKNCIPDSWRCDNVVDCKSISVYDDSDEQGCSAEETSSTGPVTMKPPQSTCKLDQWRCDSGDCILASSVCDGFSDCTDQSDEKACHDRYTGCPSNHTRCGLSSACVLDSKFCDGKKDCPNGADETACSRGNSTVKDPCNGGEHTCYDGSCVALFKVCDGTLDCTDGTDEMSCKNHPTVFQVEGIAIEEEETFQITIDWWVNNDLLKKAKGMMYSPSICEVSTSKCTNETWTRNVTYTFTNLKPSTDYVITVYARVNNTDYPPYAFVRTKTLEYESSPPYNVKVSQSSVDNLCVSWSKPHTPNGVITGYKLMFSPPTPPGIVPTANESVCLTNKQSEPPFRPDVTYSFWVVAINGYSSSKKSAPVEWKFVGDFGKVENLAVSDVKSNSAQLSWKSEDGEHTFNISCQAVAFKDYPFVKRWSTPETKFTVDKLSPGTQYTCEVMPMSKSKVHGIKQTVSFTTDGKELGKVFGLGMSSGNATGTYDVSWVIPANSKKTKYAIFYGISIDQMRQMANPILASTYPVPLKLHKQLDACETYFVDIAVFQDGVFGPLTGTPVIFKTAFDMTSPPKRLRIEKVSDVNVTVAWDSPCSYMTTKIGYNITLKETRLNRESGLSNVSYSSDQHLSKTFSVKYGGIYELQVSTSFKDGKSTPPLKLIGPQLPYPEKLSETRCETCENPSVNWELPNLPFGVNASSIRFVVHVSSDENFENAKTFETTDQMASLENVIDESYRYVAVSLKDGEGYESPLSPAILAHFREHDTIQVSKASAVEVVVVVLSVLAILVIVLSIFVLRHKKLKTTFLNFARSHYSTRADSATFQHSMEEQDTPVIRGFSDDEPLLVA